MLLIKNDKAFIIRLLAIVYLQILKNTSLMVNFRVDKYDRHPVAMQ